MSRHEEHWATFDREIDGLPAMISSDLGWIDADTGPYPLCLRVSVGVLTPGEQGQCEPEEFAVITRLEDVLVPRVSRGARACLVGSLMHAGRRTWFFRAPGSRDSTGPAVEAAVREVKERFPDYEFMFELNDDPDWDSFRENLVPSEAEFRASLDLGVISALADAGDPLEPPRKIEHCAFFPDEKSRKGFCAWAADNGFTVDEAPPRDPETGYAVEFSHVGPALPDEVTEMTLRATEGAQAFGGEYDGWQCELVRAEEPEQ